MYVDSLTVAGIGVFFTFIAVLFAMRSRWDSERESARSSDEPEE